MKTTSLSGFPFLIFFFFYITDNQSICFVELLQKVKWNIDVNMNIGCANNRAVALCWQQSVFLPSSASPISFGQLDLELAFSASSALALPASLLAVVTFHCIPTVASVIGFQEWVPLQGFLFAPAQVPCSPGHITSRN